MLAAVHVAREQQYPARRCQHEHDTDHRLLHVGPSSLRPRQQQRARERRDKCCELHGDPLGLESETIGEQHAAAGNLRDREVDEDDATGEYLRTERDVRRSDKKPRNQRRQ